MHALGEFLQAEMANRRWQQRDLVRESGLSKQHISGLLDQGKARLSRMLADRTIAGLAKALRVDERVIITKAAESMGIPVDRLAPVLITAAEVSDDVLIEILRQRLKRAGGGGDGTAMTAGESNDPVKDSPGLDEVGNNSTGVLAEDTVIEGDPSA